MGFDIPLLFSFLSILILFHKATSIGLLICVGFLQLLYQSTSNWGLQREIYSFTILKARSPKSRLSGSNWSLWRRLFHASLLTSGGCWQSSMSFSFPSSVIISISPAPFHPLPSVSLHSHGILLCLCLNFPLIKTPVIGLESTLIQDDLIITWLHLQRSYFQIKLLPEVAVCMNFRGTLFNPAQSSLWLPPFMSILQAKYIHPIPVSPRVLTHSTINSMSQI